MSTRFSKVLENTKKLPKQAIADEPRGAEPARKMGRPAGKKSSAEYVQVTVYLQKTVHTAARKILLDERKQFSDLVNELVSDWIKSNGNVKV